MPRLACAALALPVLAVPLLVAGAPSASAAPNVCTNLLGYFWENEQDMLDAYGGYCRSTFVVDPGIGQLLSRDRLLQNADVFLGQGFSRQWLWYAPATTIHVGAGSPQQWTDCPPNSLRPIGGACSPAVSLNHSFISSQDFGGRAVDLSAFAFDGRFIGRGCGNSSFGNTGADPVPTISGHKFDDVNRNGQLDGGEGGVAGIDFQLIRTASRFGDQAPGLVATATSNAAGDFGFSLSGVGPGEYVVHEVSAPGWVSTTAEDQHFPVPEGAGNATVAALQFGNRAQHPPVANAGPLQAVDQTGDDGAHVTLDGAGSSDPDGDPLTYTWTGPFGTAHGPHPDVVMPVGTNTVTLEVSDGLETTTATTSVTVYPPVTVAGTDRTSSEGVKVTGTVATFSDPDPQGTPAEYSATVDWGDGTPATTATISKAADGQFSVAAEHTYAEEGSYSAKVTVTDGDDAYNTGRAIASFAVGDAPLTAHGVDVVSTNPVQQTVATFDDANPGAPVADFTASVDWGDGTPATASVVDGSTGGPFSVNGSHTYGTLGPKTITVHIVDEGGSTATAVSHVLLYARPSGGDFVVGDLSAARAGRVTFWGAQWSKVNGLSGGSGPAAFKGFADHVATDPAGGWTTDPGNSPPPPATVPTYLGILVASRVTQTGSVIRGDQPHLMIVKTDDGYAGNPGHDGAGTIVRSVR